MLPRIFTLYSKSLPLDVACRVWDVFCRDGEESLFRTALGILRLFEDVLLQMDFIHIAQFLSRLPDDLQSHTLFNAMANTQMLSRNRRWVQVGVAIEGAATFLLSDSDYKFPLRCFPHSWRMEVKRWRRMSAHLPEANASWQQVLATGHASIFLRPHQCFRFWFWVNMVLWFRWSRYSVSMLGHRRRMVLIISRINVSYLPLVLASTHHVSDTKVSLPPINFTISSFSLREKTKYLI